MSALHVKSTCKFTTMREIYQIKVGVIWFLKKNISKNMFLLTKFGFSFSVNLNILHSLSQP